MAAAKAQSMPDRDADRPADAGDSADKAGVATNSAAGVHRIPANIPLPASARKDWMDTGVVPADPEAVDGARPQTTRSHLRTTQRVRILTTHQRKAYAHDLQLRDTFMRRLQWCQQQRAHFGMHTTFEIVDDIRQLEMDIAKLDTQIAQYAVDITARADRAVILSVEQQREAVMALSRITGLPSDKIKLVDIVVGSVVLIVDMPLSGAARLVAMQRLNHPLLRAQGFAKVVLDRIVDTQGQPLNSMFDRAVRFEEAELNAATPPSAEASPYAGMDAKARLRITLAEDAARRE